MKFSELTLEEILALPVEVRRRICVGGPDDGSAAEFALLLGGRPRNAVRRARAAAELYRAGRVKTIIPTGGPAWEYEGKSLSEADLMARILRAEGVPEEAIVPEREARDTRENMVFGIVQMILTSRRIPGSVIVVTDDWHMNRSLAHARANFPARTKIVPYPVAQDEPPEVWLTRETSVKALDNELRLMKRMVDSGYAEDRETEA